MGYCITMNTGYSGPQELPDNFKLLFIGITMISRNKESIIRVKLFLYGFHYYEDIFKNSENYANCAMPSYQNNNITISVSKTFYQF